MSHTMRAVCVVGLVAVAACLLAGCGGPKPEAAVEKFVEASKARDMEAMKALLTPESRGFLQKVLDLSGEDGLKRNPMMSGDAEVEIKSATVEGDTARVAVTMTTKDKTDDSTVTLKRLDGAWKIARYVFCSVRSGCRAKLHGHKVKQRYGSRCRTSITRLT